MKPIRDFTIEPFRIRQKKPKKADPRCTVPTEDVAKQCFFNWRIPLAEIKRLQQEQAKKV